MGNVENRIKKIEERIEALESLDDLTIVVGQPNPSLPDSLRKGWKDRDIGFNVILPPDLREELQKLKF